MYLESIIFHVRCGESLLHWPVVWLYSGSLHDSSLYIHSVILILPTTVLPLSDWTNLFQAIRRNRKSWLIVLSISQHGYAMLSFTLIAMQYGMPVNLWSRIITTLYKTHKDFLYSEWVWLDYSKAARGRLATIEWRQSNHATVHRSLINLVVNRLGQLPFIEQKNNPSFPFGWPSKDFNHHIHWQSSCRTNAFSWSVHKPLFVLIMHQSFANACSASCQEALH